MSIKDMMHEDMQTFIMVWTEIDLERGGKVSICYVRRFLK
jgi:hypothetical protein